MPNGRARKAADSLPRWVRDLPQGASQIPEKYKDEPWKNLGVNVNDNFTPIYIVPPGKSKQIKLLKDHLKEADALYLATDEALIRRHAELSGFPASKVTEIGKIIDPTTAAHC